MSWNKNDYQNFIVYLHMIFWIFIPYFLTVAYIFLNEIQIIYKTTYNVYYYSQKYKNLKSIHIFKNVITGTLIMKMMTYKIMMFYKNFLEQFEIIKHENDIETWNVFESL